MNGRSERESIWGALLFVVLAWSLLCCPNYELTEFSHEEGRRALASQEMLETGDWVVPSIWGRAYLTKPPMMFWSIATCSLADGEVTEATARMPSLLATLGTALLLCWLGTRHGSKAIGVYAPTMFMLTPMVVEKGGLAETDALLSFGCFAALALAWSGRRGISLASFGSVLALTIAVMTKGPAALVFFFAGPVALAVVDRKQALPFLGRCTLIALGSLALSSIWLVLLLNQMDGGQLQDTWSHEVRRGGDAATFAIYLKDLRKFVTRSLLGLLPGALLWGVALSTRSYRSVRRSDLERLALGCVIVGYLFFLFYPGTRARYVYPLAPWLALGAGFVLHAGFQRHAISGARVAGQALIVLVGTAGVAAVAGLFVLSSDQVVKGLAFLILGAFLTLVVAKTWLQFVKGRKRMSLHSALLILALLRGVYSECVIPARATRNGFEAKALQVEEAIPHRSTVYSSSWASFNLMAYVRNEVEFTFTPSETVPAGAVLLVQKSWLKNPPSQFDPSEWETLLEVQDRGGQVLVVLRRQVS